MHKRKKHTPGEKAPKLDTDIVECTEIEEETEEESSSGMNTP